MISAIKAIKNLFENKEKALILQDFNGQIAAISKVMGVIEFTPDGTIIKTNENFLNVVGYAEKEVIGKHHKMFVEPELAATKEYRYFWEKLALGEFAQGQYKRIAKGNREVWLEASYNPIFDTEGKVYKVVKYATDITSNKLKEADSSGQINAINKVLGVIEFTPDGIITKVNQNFLNVVGYSEREVVGQHHRMFAESDLASSENYKQFWKKLGDGHFDSGQYKRIAKDGREVWLEASYNPILDENGKVFKVVKYAIDISQAHATAMTAKTLSLVANETDNAVLITDANGLIQYVNNGFSRLTGYMLDEIKGKKPGSFLQGPLTDKDTIGRISEKIKAKKPFYDEIINYSKTGEVYWTSLSINPVFNDKGEIENYISINTNINETKVKAMEFNSRLEAISRSTAIIEFTPAGSILFANENFCSAMGYELKEVVGQHHSMFVDSAYRATSEYKEFWAKLGRGEYDSAVYKRVTKSGETIVLQASYNPIYDQTGKVIKVVKFASDITEQYNASETLAKAVEESQVVISKAKAGDLTQRIKLDGKTGEIASLCGGINAIMDKMAEVIMQIKEASEVINNAAGEISTGNNDLSSRTEQQASSLEETAASMEELASTVKQNAENAQQANQLALTASGVAVKGGQVVGEVVSTMSGINDSAMKIESIITVIDGIAFQTNILALNAAVEAARAGEQGRGFAVVAGEVRNLAQRSATAAKEIKELISDSVSKTAEGTKLVENAGTTMQEVVQSVQRVADIISEISAASLEQTTGINQVNEAVTNMDETTQQNAALVEEAAAAAESLVEQAVQLSDVVSVFKLSDEVKQERRVGSSPMRYNPTSKPKAQTQPKAKPVESAKVIAKRVLMMGIGKSSNRY